MKNEKYEVAMIGSGYKIRRDDVKPSVYLDLMVLSAAKLATETGEAYGVFDRDTGLLVFRVEVGEVWRKTDKDVLAKELKHF